MFLVKIVGQIIVILEGASVTDRISWKAHRMRDPIATLQDDNLKINNS